MLACLHVILLVCLSTCLSACQPACLPVILSSWHHVCLAVNLPACLPVNLPVCLSTCLCEETGDGLPQTQKSRFLFLSVDSEAIRRSSGEGQHLSMHASRAPTATKSALPISAFRLIQNHCFPTSLQTQDDMCHEKRITANCNSVNWVPRCSDDFNFG